MPDFLQSSERAVLICVNLSFLLRGGGGCQECCAKKTGGSRTNRATPPRVSDDDGLSLVFDIVAGAPVFDDVVEILVAATAQVDEDGPAAHFAC